MTRRRLYIQKEEGKPEFDLWLELENQYTAVPEIRICYNSQQGKEAIVNLTLSTATRLQKALEEIIEKCNEPFEDYVSEEVND